MGQDSPAARANTQGAVVARVAAVALALVVRLKVQAVHGRAHALSMSRTAPGAAASVDGVRILDEGIHLSNGLGSLEEGKEEGGGKQRY